MKTQSTASKSDFSKGPVWKSILTLSIPLIIAQLVHLLYNIVDRIFIGHIPDTGSLALTGLGITFPVVTIIMAFAALFGMGGVPLFSIERGAGNPEKAGLILGNSFSLLVISAAVLTVLGYIFCRPLLYAFGASDMSYGYAASYLRIYLIGTVFSIIATGLNGYISSQGFPRTGMLSVTIGAAVNIALDPIFIFTLNMGVAGAALATVISQFISAFWVLHFLFGKKALISLKPENMVINKSIAASIAKLGTSNAVMQGTTCLVQIACNNTLQLYGGDLYVGIMTVTNSVRDLFLLQVSGLGNGAQPVISYNYGAKEYGRVRKGVNFMTVVSLAGTAVTWLLIFLLPRVWFGMFSDDLQMIEAGVPMLRIYFTGFVFMALQFSGQTTFLSLGDAKHAITFSLLRKVIIVVPLTLILPALGFGVKGVFLAEPISNIIGGSICYITMRLTALKKMSAAAEEEGFGTGTD